jgi:hypothetical protein
MRSIRGLVATSGMTLVAVTLVAVPAAQAASPSITRLTTSSSSVPAAGGKVTVKASVKNARTCTLKSSVPIRSLPVTVDCSDGRWSKKVTIPPSSGPAKRIVLTLVAKSRSKSTRKKVGVVRAALPSPAAPPGISTFSASPSTVPATGGIVTLGAGVVRATSCRLTPPPGLGAVTSSSCAAGSVTRSVQVPANPGTAARGLPFELTAIGPGGSVTQTVTVEQPGAVTPTLTSFSATPSVVPISGGYVTVSWNVTDASACTLTLPAALGGQTSSCLGTTSRDVLVTDNQASTSPRTLVFEISASSAAGSVTQETAVDQPGAVTPTINSFSASPTTVHPGGGYVTFSWSITGSSACTFTLPAALGGTTSSCTGSTTREVYVGANSTGSARSLSFELKAISAAGTVSQTVAVGQSAT